MSQQNQSTLQAAINSQLADNTTGDISAADIRNNLINITDSLLFNSGSQGITGSFTATSFTGSLQGTSSLSITASYINPTFISASAAASGFGSGGGSSINTSSFATTGSNNFIGTQIITGSVVATSFTGSLLGTSSRATNADKVRVDLTGLTSGIRWFMLSPNFNQDISPIISTPSGNPFGFSYNLANNQLTVPSITSSFTGSINVTQLMTITPQNPLPSVVNGSISYSSSGDFYFASGSVWNKLTL
jgi:hypothetical protein